MSAVIVWAELTEGRFKKPVFEALTAARKWADALGLPMWAVVIGDKLPEAIPTLGEYGAERVLRIVSKEFGQFSSAGYARALAALMKEKNISYAILPQTYDGRAIAPMLSIWTDAALLSGVISTPEKTDSGFTARRIAYSNKGIEWVFSAHLPLIVTLKPNSFVPEKSPRDFTEEDFSFTPEAKDWQAKVTHVEKIASDKIPLTEAEIVVSAGRGLKGPENWGLVEDLAKVLGAATACSKPVADVGWRPHHEHVGQTGIQISPNLYIAIGISGAIQHLAGVASSKNIVVINNDPEAPFFKAADYGIVGDAFEVVPRLTEAIRRYKEQHAH
ncbi:MAG: electron transfer flavoprotein subunit alpha/FixB family protein [Bacteroidia bacterium]|nr:electron transfer flavoprotein subunit alpha/FixB family protein [Bacteroidia bacterium]MCX7652241.1 electron transfer flavoprotein subunit alpha/FixB family protein [Bacteroidia bacterium]MDW8416503.1 electron transfer flavoprotein subunit alpha/FixB family protein [Bacteroidia bacterium]